jgi:hypothetical protein
MSTKFLVRENTAFTPRASLIGPGQNAPPSFEENLKERSSFEQVGLECETLLSGSESSSARKTPEVNCWSRSKESAEGKKVSRLAAETLNCASSQIAGWSSRASIIKIARHHHLDRTSVLGAQVP